MDRAHLEALSIHDLRRMGAAAGLASTKKAPIVAALADDYREGPAVHMNPVTTLTPPPVSRVTSTAKRWTARAYARP